MPPRFTTRFLIPLFMLWVGCAMAQQPTGADQIDVLSPKGTNVGQLGLVIYKYTGNVKVRHQGTLLFCDQLVHYVAVNRIEAFGHVLISQGDSITVKSDSLIYDGNKSLANLRGHVMFQDRRTVLTAGRLSYDLTAGIARFTNRGRLIDGRNVLTSQEGFYDTRSRQVELQYAVKLANPESTVTTELLIYNTASRLASFVESTRITGKGGVSVVREGQYDTQSNHITQSATTATLKYAGVSNDRPATSEMGTAVVSVAMITSIDQSIAGLYAPAKDVAATATSMKKPIDKPTVAMTATASPQKSMAWEAILNKAKATRATADTTARALTVPTDVVLTLPDKTLMVAVTKPAKQPQNTSLAVSKAPVIKSKVPPTLAVAVARKETVPTPAIGNPQPERVVAERVPVVKSAKRTVMPDTQIAPSSELSDLERELNHKKRSY